MISSYSYGRGDARNDRTPDPAGERFGGEEWIPGGKVRTKENA
jgi:hypothetical protein